MLLRAIDGRFIRSSVRFPLKKNGDDNKRLPPASKFFIPSEFLICIYIEREGGREKDITNIEFTSIAPAEVANQLRCRTPISVGAWRSLAFCVVPPRFLCPSALCVGPRRSLCRGPALSVSGPGALCVGARLSLCRPCRAPALSVSGPSALCVAPKAFIWSAGPQLRSACRPSSPARSLFQGENLKPYC